MTPRKARKPKSKTTTTPLSPVIDYTQLPHRHACIRPPMDGNPNYPLPPDYFELLTGESQEEQHRRQAWWRVNAICIQETPEDLVIAACFLVNTYLWHDDAMFFDDKQTSPPAHWQMIYDIGAMKFNAFALPRSFCKTTTIIILILLMVLTRRGYRVAYVGSIQSSVRKIISKIRNQLTNNPFLLNDFGDLRPGKSQGDWTKELLQLRKPFGSSVTGGWLMGAGRGGRGDWMIFDDVETDPDTGETDPEVTRNLEMRLVKTYMPWVRIVDKHDAGEHIIRRGRGITIAGTVIAESMLLARIQTADAGSTWDYWNRWRLRQRSQDGTGFLWPGRAGKGESDLMRRIMSAEVFDSEYLNQPGESAAGRMLIHPLYHTYTVRRVDGLWASDPHESDDILTFATKAKRPGEADEYRQIEAWKLLSGCDIAVIIDWAGERPSRTSDFNVIHVMGCDWESNIWSLDLIPGRFPEDFYPGMTARSPYDAIASRLVDVCMRWRPRRIAMEACGGYGHVGDMVFLSKRDELQAKLGYVPIPWPLIFNKKKDGKAQRIDRCHSRFQFGKYRFPIDRREELGYRMLWDQVARFTLRMDGMKHDDVIDTLGMSNYVFKGPGGREFSPSPWEGRSIVELLEMGVTHTRGGHSLLSALPSLSMLSPAAEAMMENADARKRQLRQYGFESETTQAPTRRIISIPH